MQTGIRTKVSADVASGGDIVLNARLFGDIIRRMPDDVVTFTADEKQMVHLSCGDADFDILVCPLPIIRICLRWRMISPSPSSRRCFGP